LPASNLSLLPRLFEAADQLVGYPMPNTIFSC
jgi:hypothetical protein